MSQKKNIFKRAKNAVGRAFEKPSKRVPASVGASIGLNIAGGAGAGGVLLGKGETILQKIGDAVTAIPRGVANMVDHYIHAPEYARKTNAALEYLKEQGPQVAEELGQAGRHIQVGVNQAGRAMNDFSIAKDQLLPGGQEFDPSSAYQTLKDGINTLEAAVENVNAGGAQAQETAGPAIEALQDVDLNPVMNALHNLADNVAPDEIAQTIAIGAGSVLAGYAASQYVRGYWGRRGRPGILARAVQRAGLRKYSNYFTKNPEQIAGPKAVEIFEDSLVKRPRDLEALASRAGYDLTPKE
jgi:hypothetical protein